MGLRRNVMDTTKQTSIGITFESHKPRTASPVKHVYINEKGSNSRWSSSSASNIRTGVSGRNSKTKTPSNDKSTTNNFRKKATVIICREKYFFVMFLKCFIVFTSLFGGAQAKIGFFWHITDLHLDSFYSTKGDVLKSCWHIEHHQVSSSGRAPGRFGDYLCDSPWSLLESATLAMKSRQGDNVEFVLWTGDGLSHSARRLLETHRLDILRNITELLGRTFPSNFVFPGLGHDDGSNTNFRRLAELWKHWLPSEAVQTFEKGGYYTIEQTKSRLRIIVLNTNFMRHDTKHTQSQLAAVRQRQPGMGSNGARGESTEYNNFYYHHGSHHYHGDNNYGHGSGVPGSSSGGQVSALSGYDNQDTQKQWDWLEDVLDKSNRNKETVYIVGHIPPGSDERLLGSQQNGHTSFSEKNNLRYLRLVRKYSSIIQGQFFGHLHSDSFRIIYNDMGKPVSWIMISPSVTPRKMNVGSNNPAMRLYKFDTDSGQVLDYTQYYLDLDTANALGEANWQAEYNLTTHYYGLSDVSAVSLHNLADRFTNTENPLFGKYYRANSVRYLVQPCEGVCALNHYCAITRVDYREFRQCLETAASALASHSSSIYPSGSTPGILVFVLTSLLVSLDMKRKHIMVRLLECFSLSIKLVKVALSKLCMLFVRRVKKNMETCVNQNRIQIVNKGKPCCIFHESTGRYNLFNNSLMDVFDFIALSTKGTDYCYEVQRNYENKNNSTSYNNSTHKEFYTISKFIYINLTKLFQFIVNIKFTRYICQMITNIVFILARTKYVHIRYINVTHSLNVRKIYLQIQPNLKTYLLLLSILQMKRNMIFQLKIIGTTILMFLRK